MVKKDVSYSHHNGGGGSSSSTSSTFNSSSLIMNKNDSEIEMEQLLPAATASRGGSDDGTTTKNNDSNDERFICNDSRSNSSNSNSERISSSRIFVMMLMIGFLMVGVYVTVFTELFPWSLSSKGDDNNSNNNNKFRTGRTSRWPLSPQKDSSNSPSLLQNMVPQQLIDAGIYDVNNDFVNPFGIRPTYWEPTKIGDKTWGPCYPPSEPLQVDDWDVLVNRNKTADKSDIEYAKYSLKQVAGKSMKELKSAAKAGRCRPGFLIIGAGKCGTSSLYHYLVDGHPRILPASEKQIHYFKYYLNKPLAWYYSWFPTTKSFLEHGALMTGEASPGYLPYPQVVKEVVRLMGERRRSDGSVTLPKIIMVGREPLDRMYSSYRYNYVDPTLEAMSKGQVKGIRPNLPEAEYKKHLFSLEDFVRSELKQLKRCLGTFGSNRPTEQTIGFGAKRTFARWYREGDEYRDSVNDRYVSRFDKKSSSTSNTATTTTTSNKNFSNEWKPPLIDIEDVCYGIQINQTVYREQWAELQMNNPDKVILNRNLHLTQAMIGRGLYTFPLEWWYILFKPEDIFFVCTEELSEPDVLEELTMHLGLPPFTNFSGVISGGAYNVGGHKGYDEATSWDELRSEEKQKEARDDDDDKMTNGIPIPADLYNEVQEFVSPINERLFSLTGRRCNWNS